MMKETRGNERLDAVDENLTDPYKIAAYIKNATKSTPVRAYIKGDLGDLDLTGVEAYGQGNFWILFGEYKNIYAILQRFSDRIESSRMECDRRNSAIPMLDIKSINARIEPGAIIRDKVKIGNNVIIMMGAVINIGAVIGDGSMIDMNTVIGARGTIGKNVHVGAGAVIAGVLEPPSSTPVIIEDEVLIGANAVILEGVRIGKGAVIAAGSVVIEDVDPGVVVAGTPARFIKKVDQTTKDKTKLLEDLRG